MTFLPIAPRLGPPGERVVESFPFVYSGGLRRAA